MIQSPCRYDPFREKGPPVGDQTARFESHLDAGADIAYRVLVAVGERDYRVKERNDARREMVLKSHASRFTWGERIIARVIPESPGCALRLEIFGAMHTPFQVSANQQAANDLFASVAEGLRAMPRARSEIVIIYRRGDGSQAGVTCDQATYSRQVDRILPADTPS
ncbi:hypothetical protein PU630_15385 [Microbacterium horticulturae]|uniref:Uncharacterized protein n=1 Tax=Microbacterium horticulturae TaxID=3028316 RepID=A0ABY8BXK1_9MICO|nr:hypothetical protein [Microbacterium sp. KACC 23027]WEG08607.1 hypothetical protein PU630_15385 [Microbacterium sp. KACC 23027]